ncbi:MAG TPA: hypothetical protein VHC97_23790 [Thermoanaerobaculia bacterium]|jgi:hypothetical protein|nr:hypothetical protein [Thermoanaerobaculia bacterium]
MHRITTISLFALFIGQSAHAAWVPVDCKDRPLEVQSLHRAIGVADLEKVRQSYRAAVLKAKPRSPLYAPHPYPRTREEIIENFRHAYFDRLFAGKSLETLPERERPIYEALKEGRLRVDVLRIENWDLSRCTGESPSSFYYLLRFFDPSTGKEVARSKQFETGHMGIYRHASLDPQGSLPALAEVPAVLRSRFSRTMPVEQPQYVMAAGLPHCWDDSPCIAFKSQGKLYLLDGGELLYEIDAGAPRTSVTARREQQIREGLQPLGVTEMNAPLISLGFEWARARRVGGQKPQ